jgi:hypothetical protein
MNNGWIPTIDFNLNNNSGKAQLGKESADSGKILVLNIDFSSGKYTIKIDKGVGTLTLN